MPGREVKHYKALYFDLCVGDLKQYFSETNPTGGYYKIQTFLESRNFVHMQYSGYHSEYQTTDLEIFDLVNDMSQKLCWLPKCLNHF